MYIYTLTRNCMLRYLSKRNEDYVTSICTQNLKAPLITIAKARSNTNAQHEMVELVVVYPYNGISLSNKMTEL